MRVAPRVFIVALSLVSATAACGSSPSAPAKTDDEYKAEIASQMHAALVLDLQHLVAAAENLQNAAPAPADRGWDPVQDAAALTEMRHQWTSARSVYEHMEGAIAPLFPDLNAALDSRYEESLARAGAADADLFDDQGVIGLDAVERILYSDVTPPGVVAFEATLAGYHPAAFPATAQEALAFKTKLCARLVADSRALLAQWTVEKMDIRGAFQGIASLVSEQREELDKATANDDESRYSQRSLADLRDNVDGTESLYGLFRPWLASRQGGADVDAKIWSGLADVETLYADVRGEAIPPPPPGWNAAAPTGDDLQTAYGRLYRGIVDATDPDREGTIISEMDRAAALLGLPAL